MFEQQVNTISLFVTGGAVAFALAVTIWAVRATAGRRALDERWRGRLSEFERKIDRLDTILASHPGVVMVWEDDGADGEMEWGKPRLYGSPPALASLLQFCDASDGPDTAARILDGLADYEARDAHGGETTLRRGLNNLRESGSAFSLTICGPDGWFLDADGRPAGRRAVLWIADSTVKGIAESGARRRIEESRQHDPMVVRDLAGKTPSLLWRVSSGQKLSWANSAYLEAVECANLNDAIERDLMLDERVRDQAREVLAKGGAVEDLRIVTAGGQQRRYAVTGYPVSGGVGFVAHDMSKAEAAREALERHVRAQDDAINEVADAVAVFGPNQELVFHNPAFARLFEFDEAWLALRPQHSELLDRMRDARLVPPAVDHKAWKANELKHYEAFDADESRDTWSLPGERVLSVIRLQHPLGGLVMIVRDISAETTVKQELNQHIRVQRATLDKLNEGVAVFDSDGRLRLHNAAFERMWRLSPDDLEPGRAFDDVAEACLPLFHHRDEWATMKARITDPRPEARTHVVGEMRRGDLSVLTFLSRPLPDGATVLAFHDITAERDLADALSQRAAALEDADRVKADFVAHVSYQLRAPMQSIMGYAELLTETVAGKLAPRDAEWLGSIFAASQDLNKLVGDIVDIAAIDAKTLEIERSDMAVRPALESAIDLVRTGADDTKVRMALAVPEDVGSISADERRVKQVVYNLLVNALRHSKPGGKVEVGAERDASSIAIWVADDGEGIAPEKQARVFERFESGSNHGAGLGLTLVREFVEMHGGWVEMESSPEDGTRVTCHFPLKGPETRRATPLLGESAGDAGGAPDAPSAPDAANSQSGDASDLGDPGESSDPDTKDAVRDVKKAAE